MHIAIVPVLLGGGERLFDDLGPSTGSYRCVDTYASPALTHVRTRRPLTMSPTNLNADGFNTANGPAASMVADCVPEASPVNPRTDIASSPDTSLTCADPCVPSGSVLT